MTLHLRSFTFLCAADKENLLLHAGKRSNQSKSDKTYVKILWKSDLDLNVPLQLAWSTTTHKPTSAKTMKSRIPMHAQTVPIPTIILPYKCILLIPDTWLELAEVSASGVKSVNCAGGKWYMYLLIYIRQVITCSIIQPVNQYASNYMYGNRELIQTVLLYFYSLCSTTSTNLMPVFRCVVNQASGIEGQPPTQIKKIQDTQHAFKVRTYTDCSSTLGCDPQLHP